MIPGTFKVHGDLLYEPARSSAIHNTNYETHSYGSHERHKLDMYTPSRSTAGPADPNHEPILGFFYGGGFIMGDRILPEHPHPASPKLAPPTLRPRSGY